MDESSITTKPTTYPCGDIVSDRVVNPYELGAEREGGGGELPLLTF